MKRMALGGAIALALFLCPRATGFAKDREDRLDTPTYKKCMNEANGITVEMHGCLAEELERQNKLLNDTYKAVMDTMVHDAQKIRLRHDEREWIKRTATKCDAAGQDSAGGTAEPLLIDDCYIQETETRTLYLRKIGRIRR
jgi:uncharacterized protein YecT (DUF1311 family)